LISDKEGSLPSVASPSVNKKLNVNLPKSTEDPLLFVIVARYNTASEEALSRSATKPVVVLAKVNLEFLK